MAEGECRALIAQGKQLSREGVYGEAASVFERALGAARQSGSAKLVAMTLDWLGDTHRALGDPAAALRLYEEARPLAAQEFGADSMEMAWLLRGMTECLRAAGQLDRARELIREFGNIYATRCGRSSHRFGIALKQLGVLLMSGDADYAHLMAALSRFEDASLLMDHETMNYAILLDHMSLVLVSLDEFDRALELRLQQCALVKRLRGENHPDHALALAELARLYSASKQVDAAVEVQQQALTILTVKLGAEHRFAVQAREELDVYRRAQNDLAFADTLALPERICRACSSLESYDDVLTCDGCQRVFYCSQECRDADLEAHAATCGKRARVAAGGGGD